MIHILSNGPKGSHRSRMKNTEKFKEKRKYLTEVTELKDKTAQLNKLDEFNKLVTRKKKQWNSPKEQNKKKKLRNYSDYNKWNNIYSIEVPKKEDREKGKKLI